MPPLAFAIYGYGNCSRAFISNLSARPADAKGIGGLGFCVMGLEVNWWVVSFPFRWLVLTYYFNKFYMDVGSSI